MAREKKPNTKKKTPESIAAAAEKARPEMVYKITLKERFGLTDTLIRELGEPDETVPNPHHKSGPPAGLYVVERVQHFVQEHKVEIDEAAARRAQRQSAAAKAVKTKTAQLVEVAETIPLKLKPLPPTFEELRNIASRHANDRHGVDAREPGYRGIVAVVRHQFTNYESILGAFRGKVGGGRTDISGSSPAYLALRDRLGDTVDEHIRRSYPHLFKYDNESGEWIFRDPNANYVAVP